MPPPGAHSSAERLDATLASMVRLLETFFRHRLLLLGPVVLVLVGAMGWVLIQPPTYSSSVRVWVEKQTLVPDPNENPYLTPAQEQAGVLTELIDTKYFDAKVGRRSPLFGAIKAASAHGSGGIRTHLMRLVGLAGPAGTLTDSQVDDQVFGTILASTLVIPSGPEIMTVTYSAGDPQMATMVAQAIVDQYMDETLTNERTQADAAVAFYMSQVKQSQADMAVADKAVDDYLLANPSQRGANAVPDARMLQLRQDDDAAHQRTNSVLDKLDTARLNRVALDQSGTSGIRVLDKAELPTSPSSIKKVVIEAVGVGLVLAILIVVVGVLALTWLDSTIRGPQEVETILDLRPVGSVPRVS